MYKIIVNLPKDGAEGRIELWRESEKLASEKYLKAQMAETFLEKIQTVLDSNGLKTQDINDYVLETQMPDNYTSYRIAKMTLETLKWSNK